MDKISNKDALIQTVCSVSLKLSRLQKKSLGAKTIINSAATIRKYFSNPEIDEKTILAFLNFLTSVNTQLK